VIEDVERTTGKPVVLRPELGLRGKAHASYAASDPDESRHLILYDPEFASSINHLVPHELGHVSLFAYAGNRDRLLPHIGPEQRRLSRTTLRREVPRHALDVLKSETETDAFLDLWSDGLVMQVYNYPQDILIERSVFESHPALRSSQRGSIAQLAQEAHDGLTARAITLTPRTVTLAAQSMNYALLKSCSGYLGAPWMVRPYRNTSMERTGEELLDLLRASAPENLGDCLDVTGVWSRRLGVDGWFRLDRARSSREQTRSFWEPPQN